MDLKILGNPSRPLMAKQFLVDYFSLLSYWPGPGFAAQVIIGFALKSFLPIPKDFPFFESLVNSDEILYLVGDGFEFLNPIYDFLPNPIEVDLWDIIEGIS